MVEFPKAVLVLENGSVYSGRSFGYQGDSIGEVCFNTSMSGYQEILTDPSYYEQLVTLTYPMIGNYGIDPAVNESDGIKASGLIVKQYCRHPSNFTSVQSLSQFLIDNEKPGLEGIDTRKLTLEIRNEGAMRGGIFTGVDYTPELLERVRSAPQMNGRDLASLVTTAKPYRYGDGGSRSYRMALLDFGVKTSILRLLDEAGFEVHVYPATTTAAELKAENFDAYFLSNGPGDPEPLTYAIETVRQLLAEKKPLFGICLGHQLLSLAAGVKTYKLKFGHRGGNQPVKNFLSGRVEITSQNHGFAAERSESGYQLTHINLNDDTVEGYYNQAENIMGVQFHPEASPGPHDSGYLFQEFFRMVDNFQRRS